ncbi:MAG: hypothetical protein LBK13_00095 [Spirochaetales bacterium]|jgi:hypothetical protein|nr:hypothetical protein [Spirochaetales bacterium]
MIFAGGSTRREVSGITEIEKRVVLYFLQGAVYRWCKNKNFYMKKRLILAAGLVLSVFALVLTGCLNLSDGDDSPSPGAQWARSLSTGTDWSLFSSVAADDAGDVYTVGVQRGTGTYNYGNGVTATGTSPGNDNAVLVKYDSSGEAHWARSLSAAGTGNSEFSSVAADSAGDVYAAGSQYGTEAFDYGNGVTVVGTASGANNAVLAKYDSSGAAYWARSLSAGTGNSEFSSVAADSAGNVYAAGYQFGTGTYDYGGGVTVTGAASGANAVLVKYDSSGTAHWARSVSTGKDYSEFTSVAVDSAGNVYAAGFQEGTWTYTYGSGVTATGTASGANAVLVKYDSAGTAHWVRSLSAGTEDAEFGSVAADSAGNVYVAGFQYGTGTYDYGGGVTVAGASTNSNVVLVKYDSSGAAHWAQSLLAGKDTAWFNSVAVDDAGNVYAVGQQFGTGTYSYGTGVRVTGVSSSRNVVLVKYDSAGAAHWARSLLAGADWSSFTSVAAGGAGNVYAAGSQYGTGTFDYGGGVTATGTSSSDNVVLVKYSE